MVLHIVREQFVAEVTEASKDVWVVTHLYKDKWSPSSSPYIKLGSSAYQACCTASQPKGRWAFKHKSAVVSFVLMGDGPILRLIRFQYCRVPDSAQMGECIEKLAAKYNGTKFVKIISNDCIPGYPDRNLPTILVYNNTECKHNLVGRMPFGGRITPEGEKSLPWMTQAFIIMLVLLCSILEPYCSQWTPTERASTATPVLSSTLTSVIHVTLFLHQPSNLQCCTKPALRDTILS